MARDAGLSFRRSKDRLPTATVHKVLRNRALHGRLRLEGQTYRGHHEPLDHAANSGTTSQDVLDGRHAEAAPQGQARLRLLGADRRAATAAARWSARSRRSGTSTTTARATRGSAPSRTRGRRS